MLKKIHITYFLSCQDTAIELNDITAFIGRNAAGKTNILKAIHWCAQFAVGNKFSYREDESLYAECSLEFLIDDKLFRYDVANNDTNGELYFTENLYIYEDDNWDIISKRIKNTVILYNTDREINLAIERQAPMISSILALLPSENINKYISVVYLYLKGIHYYTLDITESNTESESVIPESTYSQWVNNTKNIASNAVMKLLNLWHENKEIIEELESLLGSKGLNLINEIRIFKIDPGQQTSPKPSSFHIDPFYIIRFLVSDSEVQYHELSFGTKRILHILLALLYDKNSTLLIEQPEDGIHSGLLKKLLPLCFEYSKAYNKQLIIATHSPEVINLLAPKNIRLVRMTKNGTKVSSLDKNQLPYISDYIENEGTLFEYIEGMEDR